MPTTTSGTYSFWTVWQPEATPVLTITPPTSVTNTAPIASLFIPAISANVVVTAASNGVYNNSSQSLGYVGVTTLYGPATNVQYSFSASQGLYPTSIELYAGPNAASMYVLVICSTEVAVSNVVNVTASLPLTSSGGTSPNIALTTPLTVAYGGTGTATPSLIAGSNITVTGTWPNQTVAATGVGGVSSVAASSPLASSGGTTPTISLTGVVPIANGGTGTASPSLVAGTNITITGSWPNQTVTAASSITAVTATAPLTSSGGTTPNISFTGTVPVANGGTGTATPSLVAGSGITITGSFPNQTVASSGVSSLSTTAPITNTGTSTAPVIALTTPLAVNYGGTGSATQNFVDLTSAQTIAGAKTFSTAPTMSGANIASGTIPDASLVTAPVTSVTGSTYIASSGGTTPTISLTGIIPVANGGNGTATPSLVAGTNTTVSGTWPAQAVNLVAAPNISGANFQTGTIPDAALVTAPVTSVVGSSNITSSGGTTPTITLVSAPTISGANFTALTVPNTALIGPVNGTYDVTKYGVAPGNTAAANTTALNNLVGSSATAPAGSIIYFPGGTYSFSGLITVGNAYIFQGQGTNYSGGFTILQQTANVGGLFTITAGKWYSQFRDMVFSANVAQTSGAAVNAGNSVGINFYRCQFQGQSATQTWYDAIDYVGANSANSTIVSDCQISGFTNYGVYVNSAGASLVIEKCVIQGIYGTSTQVAAAGVATIEAGAIQIDNCDILGSTNNLLLNPTSGNVVSSVFVANTYFDNASGSCIKITGAGATVRTRFNQCSFTLASTASGFAAAEVSTTYASGAQGLDFLNCNVLNTFATTGTSYGFNFISGAADTLISNCRVAGWTTGINVAPLTSITALQIQGSVVGTAGGYSGNANGIVIGTGTYASLQIRNNILVGNTTASIVDNSTAAIVRDYGNNIGAPVSGVAQTSTSILNTAINTTKTQLVNTYCGTGILIGSTFRFRIYGTNTSSAAGTSTFTLTFGTAGTTADASIATVAITSAATGTAVPFFIDIDYTVRTIGSTGNGAGYLKLVNGTSATTGITGIVVSQDYVAALTTTATLNTTLNGYLGINYVTSATTCTTTFQGATVELVGTAA